MPFVADGEFIYTVEGNGYAVHGRRKAFADANGIRFLSTGGDHLGMVFAHGAQSATGIRAFVDEVAAQA